MQLAIEHAEMQRENLDYIIDLKQAREGLDTIQNLNEKVNRLTHELEIIKSKQ